MLIIADVVMIIYVVTSVSYFFIFLSSRPVGFSCVAQRKRLDDYPATFYFFFFFLFSRF